MPIKIRFIGLVIPLLNIKKSDIDFSEYLIEQSEHLGTKIDYDGYIYVYRSMSSEDIESAADFWIKHGLTDIVVIDGEQTWQDFCVIDFIGGATLPCPWIEYSRDTASAWIKGCNFESTVPENRPLLLKQAWEINSFLDQLIEIRNKRMDETGTFTSLFRKHDFKPYKDNADRLSVELGKKVFLYEKIKSAAMYRTFTDLETQLFDCLLKYTQAIHVTSLKLKELTEATYQKSLSASNGISLADYMKLDKEYEDSIAGYIQYGGKLNVLFDELNAG